MTRRGFTLIELLIVLAIIAALLGLGWPAVQALRERQAQERTLVTVRLVATAIAGYRGGLIEVPAPDGGTAAVRPLWDFNRDGLIDGDPALDEGFAAADRAAAAAAGYRGLLAHTGLVLPSVTVDAQGRVVDAWRRPLRLLRDADRAARTGVWSAGRDGRSDTTDDLRSWSDAP